MQCPEMEHCASNGRSKETFRLVKKLCKGFQPRQLAIKDSSGKLLSTKDEVIGRWTEYCSELYKGKQDCSTTVAELISIAPPLREEGEMDILFEEVQAAIDRLKRNKSSGTDGITAEMIQAGGEPLARVLPEGGAYARRMARVSNRDYPEERRSKGMHQLQNNNTYQPRMESYVLYWKGSRRKWSRTWPRHRQGSEVIAVQFSKS